MPLDLERNPFEDALAPTFRRILRDNGASHPLIEARRALEDEVDLCRAMLGRAWSGYQRYGSQAAWEQAAATFRERISELNRHIKLNNLRAPIPNFHVATVDIEGEIRRVTAAY
jgi:hypothetical protein